MFNLPSFIRSFFVLLVIGAVIFAATTFSSPIKSNVSKVLGTHVTEQSNELPKELQKDVSASVEGMKDKALKTDVTDLVDLGSRVRKVINDYHALQREIQKKADEFFAEESKGKQKK
jgi:hypothetical protein